MNFQIELNVEIHTHCKNTTQCEFIQTYLCFDHCQFSIREINLKHFLSVKAEEVSFWNSISTFYSFPQSTTIYHKIRSQRLKGSFDTVLTPTLMRFPAPPPTFSCPKTTTKTTYLLLFLFAFWFLKNKSMG